MGTTKKEENRKPRKKETEGPETNEIVCKGLLLVPIHKDTKSDLETENESVVVGHHKKNRKARKEEHKARS